MFRSKVDELVDGVIDGICEVEGLDPKHSTPTKAMRDAGQSGGDRDEAHSILGKFIRRNFAAIVEASTGNKAIVVTDAAPAKSNGHVPVDAS